MLDPRISLMGIQPQFSLFDLGATMRTGQQLQLGRLAITEEQRQQQEAQAIREAYRQQYGGSPPAPGLASLGPTVQAPQAGEAPFPPLAEQEAAASQQALYGAPPPAPSPAPTVPSGSPQGLGGLAGQMGGGGSPPAGLAAAPLSPRDDPFVRSLYRISPQAGRTAEAHEYDTRALQVTQHQQRAEFLARVADGILEGDSQQAYETGRAMLIQQGMPPSQMPATYDRAYVRQLSGMGHDSASKLQLAQARLADAKAQSERGQAPTYTGNEAIDSLLYSRFGDQIPPGQRPTPAMVQEARREYLATDPQQRLYGQRARREAQEAEAFEAVQDVEPGAPGAAPRAGAGRPAPLTASQAGVADEIRAEARRQGVDPDLAVAVARQESSLDPRQVGDNGRSVGVFQLQEAAAREAGIDPRQRSDRPTNIRGGVRYLKMQLDKEGGDVDRALSRYNRGTPRYEGRGDPNYVRNVKRYMRPAGAPASDVAGGTAPGADAAPAGAPVSQYGAGPAGAPAPAPEGGLVRRLAGNGGAAPPPQAPIPSSAAPGAAAPARLTADEQRLTRLEALRDKQEAHIAILRPLAGSEAGSKRLTQAERELSRRQSEIDTLRSRLYEQGPESLERKEAVAKAGVEAALDKPLSSDDAALYGVPGGTTARELRDRVGKTPAPLSGEAAKTYQMGARMNRGHEAVAALEAVGVTGTPFLNTLEQTVDKLTGAIGTVVGVAAGGGFAGAGAGGAAGLGVGNLASPLVNQLRTPEQRRYVTAQLAFIAGILRKESGAAITAEEYRQYTKIYFPQSGDDADTIAAKSAMRAEEIASLQEQFPNRTFPGAPAATTKVRPQAEREPGILQPRPSERPQPGQRGWPYQPGGALLD